VERCRIDPELGAHGRPLLADELLSALPESLRQQPPPGWGVDSRLQAVAAAFAAQADSVEVGLAQLACLAEVCDRTLPGQSFAAQHGDSSTLRSLFERLMIAVAHEGVAGLRADARSDALTGLGNRRAFDLAFGMELARAERHQRCFSVALIDLDGLKAINDSRGHTTGDARLQDGARRLATMCRSIDSAYRVGGDEFVVLLPETDGPGAGTFVGRLRAGPMPAFSYGTATFPADGHELLDVADRRLSSERARRGSSAMPPVVVDLVEPPVEPVRRVRRDNTMTEPGSIRL
jgi:GGDEF domain-containing protein